jgi:hypothetical protein
MVPVEDKCHGSGVRILERTPHLLPNRRLTVMFDLIGYLNDSQIHDNSLQLGSVNFEFLSQ